MALAADAAREHAAQGEKLGLCHPVRLRGTRLPTDAEEAKFITAQDPIIETLEGKRLPAVPVHEALHLNTTKARAEGREPAAAMRPTALFREGLDGSVHGIRSDAPTETTPLHQASRPGAPLRRSIPQTTTNPLFPPIATYGPPSLLRDAQCLFFRASSAFLSCGFLLAIVLGCVFNRILPAAPGFMFRRLLRRNPLAGRPFAQEEEERKRERHAANQRWVEQQQRRNSGTATPSTAEAQPAEDPATAGWPALEGGPDPLTQDIRHYARRVGLDMETFDVQTEDGFIIELLHLYDPRESAAVRPELRTHNSASLFSSPASTDGFVSSQFKDGNRKYPVLLMHGLLQHSGAFACSDDKSLAFYLAKSGYDVWLGNNRCGFKPRHTQLHYGDPRMWAWNIRQMGVLDLPALVSRVLEQTGFAKLGLICHSQGTTETFVALAKEQRPELGDKISVFCALAPAVYAGPLIQKAYFKFMHVISPSMFRIVFGIHSFIPLMIGVRALIPKHWFGFIGYHVFSYLFDWTDERWERDLRARGFQFAPVYISAESMRWWLGRECFAKHKCILATREEALLEDQEDEEEDKLTREAAAAKQELDHPGQSKADQRRLQRERYAWYNEHAPPFALWVAGNDNLVDGYRLLRRFDKGREPFVHVVHKKIIEGYEHLDVIWAMDSIDKVGREVREVLWRTASPEARAQCRTPVGCEHVEQWIKPSSTTKTDAMAGDWTAGETDRGESPDTDRQ